MVGIQFYVSHLRQFFLKNSRTDKFSQEHSTLLSHLDNLFTPLPGEAEELRDERSLERARKIIHEIGMIIDNVVHKEVQSEGHHVRMEQFFCTTDIHADQAWTASERLPPLSSAIRLMSQKDVSSFVMKIRDDFYKPLVKMLGRPGSGEKDLSVFSPEERTAATALAEVCLTFAESDNILKEGAVASASKAEGLAGHAIQPPLRYRVGLTPERKEATGLLYGVHPAMIPANTVRNTQGTSTVRQPSGTRAVSAAARLKGKVRIPHKCIQAQGQILHLLHTHEVQDEDNRNDSDGTSAPTQTVEGLEGTGPINTESNLRPPDAGDDEAEEEDADEFLTPHGCYESVPFSCPRQFGTKD